MIEASQRRYLIDPYLDWVAAEGVPCVEDFCVDLNAVETKHWDRFGVDGAVVNMIGRGDFISIFLFDLAPGTATLPQRHLYEEVFYVLSGHGSCEVEDAGGRRRSFEWGTGSMFALPLNAPYRLYNGSGRERARLSSTNSFAMVIKAFRNEGFIFENPWSFPEREGKAEYLEGRGERVPYLGKRTLWETNFVADLRAFELDARATRGAGEANMQFILAEGTMHAHCSQMPVGTYKKAHRHGPDFHVLTVKGEGFSLFWYQGDADYRRYDWHPGCVFAPANMMFHQHFNTSAEPVRYLATAYGSGRYPFSEEKIRAKRGVDVSVDLGGSQIEYEDQDPRIHATFVDELRKHGAPCRMSEFMDERTIGSRFPSTRGPLGAGRYLP